MNDGRRAGGREGRALLIALMLLQTVLMLVVIAALLFWPAGTVAWPAAWVFIGEMGVFSLLIGAWLARKDPQLLAERLRPPIARDQKAWDRVFMAAALVCVSAWFAGMGWDGGRSHRGAFPWPMQAAGGVLVALCMVVCWITFGFNSFASPVVKVQAQRLHRVVTAGPYGVVRHPMYAGALLYFVGVPLLLGSWLGLAAAPVFVVGLAFRARAEERELMGALVDYGAYAAKVRYRLIPGVW